MMSTKEAYEDYLDVLADKIEYKELDITECTFDFHVIDLPNGGFLGKRNYCNYCQVSYKRENEHKCPLKCDRCFRFESNCEGEEIQCDDCFRSFKGRRCFRNHKYKPKKADGSKKASVCEVLYKCLKCKRILNKIKRKPEDHVCGERMCDNCREWVDKDHKCYMKMKNAKGGLCEYSCSKMGKERLCLLQED
ncbi:uncharacterized protein TNCV_1150691 [Trichonephila clavipes]|nr:uncharacterized protein TNCV_1150691 [Trichonephila clavipes]